MLRRSIRVAKRRIDQEKTYAQISEEEYKRAQNILGYAFKIPETWSDACQLLIAMIPKMEAAGYRNGWIQYLEQGLLISAAQQDVQNASELAVAVGYLELVQANFDVAEGWFKQARDGFSQLGDHAGEGKALNRLARLKLDQEEFDASVSFARSALSLLEKSDIERANSHYAIGSVHRIKGDLVEAESHYHTSLKIWEGANDQRRIAWGLGNLGLVFYHQKKYNASVSYFTQSLDIFEHTYDPANEAQIKNSLAVTYWQMRRFDEAAQLFIHAQKAFLRLKDDLGAARIMHNLGMYYFENAQWSLAHEAYHKCLALWGKLGLTYSLCNTLDGLGEVYLATKDFEKSIATFQHGLDELAKIPEHPSYELLKKSLTTHLREARLG